jgi:hypothetical protein
MRTVAVLALVLAGCSRPGGEELNAAAAELGGMAFDANAPIATSGHVTAAVWPEGGVGMIVVETGDGLKYAFSTAGVPEMAKQGFTRKSMGPGEEVGVSGVLAPGKTVGDGLMAARADVITKGDGTRVFTR